MRKKKDADQETEIKLPESELKVMQFIWERKAAPARDISEHMMKAHGWKKNTAYTVLSNLIGKGVIDRKEPGFVCRPLIQRDKVGQSEADSLLMRFYEGSASALFSSFMSGNKISPKELSEIKEMIERYEE